MLISEDSIESTECKMRLVAHPLLGGEFEPKAQTGVGSVVRRQQLPPKTLTNKHKFFTPVSTIPRIPTPVMSCGHNVPSNGGDGRPITTLRLKQPDRAGHYPDIECGSGCFRISVNVQRSIVAVYNG